MVAQKILEEKLDSLRREYERLLPRKVKQIGETWDLLRESGDPGTLSLLYRLVHSLAGSGATFGFTRLSQCAKEVEASLLALEEKGEPLGEEDLSALGELFDTMREAAFQKDASVEQVTLTSIQPQSQKVETQARLFLYSLDPIFSQQLRVQLSFYDFQVSLFADLGNLLREANRQKPPSVLIFDLAQEGFGVAHLEPIYNLSKELNTKIPMVFLLPRGDDATFWLRAVQIGARACFSKPLGIGFLEKIHEIVSPNEEPPYRLMIVDDDKVLSNHIGAIMEKAGMDVLVINEPTRVLQPMFRFKPDLILMDLHMPECSGLDLARVVRQYEDFVSTPIVYLSSETQVNKRLEALDLGADDFLIKPIQYRYLYFSLSSRIKRARQLRTHILADGLTGQQNHTTLWRRLGEELVKASQSRIPLTFALVDIDNFHEINEEYGHPAGDRVLRGLAMLLRRRIRQKGIIGRYGGEEFGVVLVGFEEAEALDLMDQIREDFSEIVHDLDRKGFHATISVGLAGSPAFETARLLSKAAECAVNMAKERGRNQVLIYPKDRALTFHQSPPASDDESVRFKVRDESEEPEIRPDSSIDFLVFNTDSFNVHAADAQVDFSVDGYAEGEQPIELTDEENTISFEDLSEEAPEEAAVVDDSLADLDPEELAEALDLEDDQAPDDVVEGSDGDENDDDFDEFSDAPLVVVVDDEREMRELVKNTLKNNGFRVLVAADGDQGFELALQHEPVLLITDLLLFPGIHGFELCRRVRAHPKLKDLRIMVMTGVYKSYRYRMEARDAGVDEFMEKPLDLEKLVQNACRLTLA
ncbi:response regulator [Sulfidibacter corallicola]|uniref:Response regulator n=1 Tax=Sulfidibacter corallicola TaxID=2818388 RepID=A0A8A4TD17_SULCO|nr:response regulator [Sulfidibacter corallicola]QTD47563.1 response regulator [Sulfidibacter corallicola]